MDREYKVIIGLEVHVELKTNTKIFCSCKSDFSSDPNTNICPVCLGLPGGLPRLNKKVVEYAIMAGLSTNCSIRERGRQDRKNYFYPDSPKAYQISQDDLPICYDGYLDISAGGREKEIGIERIHIEEDAGKLIHDEGETLVDFNRAGVPLIEIVTLPVLEDEEQVVDFLQKLRNIMIYTGISDARMNEGSFRCDVNISLSKDSNILGTRAEIKNLNSFNSIRKAIKIEIKRQEEVLREGGSVVQETRGYDDNRSITYSMREKEEEGDYRYFPDPDLAPIFISREFLNRINDKLPELAHDRKNKYMKKYGLNSYDAEQVIISKEVADFFEECMKYTSYSKTLVNILVSEIFSLSDPKEFDINIKAEYLGELVNFLEEGKISNNGSKKVINIMNKSGGRPEEIIKENSLGQINDTKRLEDLASEALENNGKAAEEYKSGKKKALQSIIGEIMRETRGRANPKLIKDILEEKLKTRS